MSNKRMLGRGQHGLTIRGRLLFGFLVVLLCLLSSGVTNGLALAQLDGANEASRREAERMTAALEVGRATSDLLVTLAEAAYAEDLGSLTESIREAQQTLEAAVLALEALVQDLPVQDPVRTAVSSVQMRTGQIDSLASLIVQAAETENWENVRYYQAELLVSYRRFVTRSLKEIVTQAEERQALADMEAEAAQRIARIVPVGFVVLALVISGATAWTTVRGIAVPVERLTEATSRLAARQLGERVPVERNDELGRLAIAFNVMAQDLEALYAGLEQQVAERTVALEEANAELEAFAYSVSHDLRAPLRAMQGFSQALLEDYEDQLDKVGRDYAWRIVGAAQRMDTLIQDLLAYSRLARVQIDLRLVSLEQVIEEALTQLEAVIQEKEAVVTLEKPLPLVVAHYTVLVQVVGNLISNGIKFVAQGVRPEVRIWAEKRNGKVRLWVEDNGIGIAPEHQERIFRVFERLHGVETYPGTGVGLAVVRKGMTRLGGHVGLESEVEQGSRFWIELPAEHETTGEE